MTALPLIRRKFTPEEYLSIERNADSKSELLDGEIYAMSGASPDHVTITDNLTGELHARLKGNPCQVMSRDMKVMAGSHDLYAYPDALIVCGEKKYLDATRDVLMNPVVLFEVLSPSTQQYDRTTKFDRYKQIETLRDYVLITQDEVRVEHYALSENGAWSLHTFTDIDDSLTLTGVPLTIAISDLYDRLPFASRS